MLAVYVLSREVSRQGAHPNRILGEPLVEFFGCETRRFGSNRVDVLPCGALLDIANRDNNHIDFGVIRQGERLIGVNDPGTIRGMDVNSHAIILAHMIQPAKHTSLGRPRGAMPKRKHQTSGRQRERGQGKRSRLGDGGRQRFGGG